MTDKLTGEIVDCAFQVHSSVGPGLLENAYQQCLAIELAKRGLKFEKEKDIPLFYNGQKVDVAYRADFIVENEVIIELKSVEKLISLHDAQILTYMKLASLPKGLLINFNTKLIRDGIKRFVL